MVAVNKHREEIEKNLNLAIGLRVVWNTKVEIVPLVSMLWVPYNTVRNLELLHWLTTVNVHQLYVARRQ